MALIRLGALITQISGKIGGQTLGTSASGSYIKNSGTPRKTITLLQRQKMAEMATTAQKWRTLTPSQRNVFVSASSSYPYLNRVGETKYYTGYQIFCKLSRNFANALGTGIPAPLPVFSFNLVGSATITQSALVTTWRVSGGQTGVEYRLFCSRPASMGITQGYKNQFFIKASASSPLATGVDIRQALTDKFGLMKPGDRVYWRMKAIQTVTGQELDNIATGYFDT